MKDWHLKKGSESRIKSGHPWVFAGELANSPTDAPPGSPIRLLDAKGNFLATGYGNHHSQIVFRGLSWLKDEEVFTDATLIERITIAAKHRLKIGYQFSSRLVFSEADDLPGLILDRYLLKSGHQVLAFQVLTAGMEKWFKEPSAILEQVAKNLGWNFKKTILIARNDVNVRKLEGLKPEPAKVLRNPEELPLSQVTVLVNDQFSPEKSLELDVDLIEGQKTGFFLDQTKNMKLVIEALKARRPSLEGRTLRVLDLCCYVGNWSLQLGNALKQLGLAAELHLVDVSQQALQFAKGNAEKLGLPTYTYELDVLKETDRWPAGPFDIIVVDPPAFVKNRKDLPTGEHAYMKLNTEAFQRTHAGSLVVSCSCSGLVSSEVFEGALAKALRRTGRRGVWALAGGQGEDHPVRTHFQEGRYLKMVMTEILESFTRKK